MPTPTIALTGADAELIHILDRDEVLVCTRVWEAWHYKTMGPDDFESYTNGAGVPDSGVTEILAWRDAAVETFRTRLVTALRSAELQTLGLHATDAAVVDGMSDFIADFVPED